MVRIEIVGLSAEHSAIVTEAAGKETLQWRSKEDASNAKRRIAARLKKEGVTGVTMELVASGRPKKAVAPATGVTAEVVSVETAEAAAAEAGE